MGYTQFLTIEGIKFPAPDSYNVEYSSIESEENCITEAGTKQRDIVRASVIKISVSFVVTNSWLGIMVDLQRKSSLYVEFFEPRKYYFGAADMYMDNFKTKLIKDTSKNGLWEVSFDLVEY